MKPTRTLLVFAVFVQVALGVALVSGQHINPPKFHMFYGFIAIITVGLAYSYRQQLQKVYLWYGAFGPPAVSFTPRLKAWNR